MTLSSKHPQDPKTGKFIKKEPLTFNESFEKYLGEEAKVRGCTPQEVASDLFSREFALIEFDEAKGEASMTMYAGTKEVAIKDMKPEDLMKEYKDLRENFAPVSAGIEYHKTFLCGSGFDVISNDPRDKHKVEMRDEIQKLCRNVHMDYYRQGLDKLSFILADDVLTFGMAAAEIIYKKVINFEDFADPKTIAMPDGTKKKVWETRMPTQGEWKSFKGIDRLKIIEDANSRLQEYIDPKTFETKYWTLDAKVRKTLSEEIAEKVGVTKKNKGSLFHPFEIFWLSWNTRGTKLKGESIIRPALEIARLVRRIQKAIGKGFDRWADRKYFFVCGTEKRPWNKNAQRRFVKYLELMIKNHWSGVPVPAGFDVKDIGGQVFEGTNILNHLINMICAAMNYPRDFLEQGKTRSGDKAWLAWQVKYGSNQRMYRRDIENQLFQKHLWCKFGFTYRVPKQNVDKKDQEKRDIYIPKIMWKAEGRWQKAEETKSLQGWLNVANPIGPEFKLAVEKRGAEILGFGSIQFPSHAELRKQIKMEAKLQELQIKKMMEGDDKLAKRQDKGVSKKLAPTGQDKKPPPKAGGSRKPAVVKKGMKNKSFGEARERQEEEIAEMMRVAVGKISLPTVPIEIRIKNDPTTPTKIEVDVHVKTPDANKDVIEEKIKTEKEKQKTEGRKQEAAESVKEKISKS